MTNLATTHIAMAQSAYDQLQVIRDALCNSPELTAKTDIQSVAHLVDNKIVDNQTTETDLYSLPGDDCAAIPNGDGYQLLAMEGMLPEFVKQDPWHAGWSSVMANVSDIAAMGGRATAVVNAYWHHDQAEAAQMLKGIKKACDVFGVRLAGGHTSMSASHQAGLAVSVLGYATHLLSCHHLRPGQCVYMVADLNGQWHGDKPYWNAVTGKKREQIRSMWNLLPEIAESGLVTSAKDISNGGVLGTLLMMLELTKLGATIDLNEIPAPAGQVDFIRWLKAFQSFGFLLAGPPEHAMEVQQYFSSYHITCKPIGTITERPTVVFDYYEASMEFWDLAQKPITGITFADRKP
ncbi:MAG: sll0787 family AIR synthase-like protein [Gammaproteobacteria bacterium]